MKGALKFSFKKKEYFLKEFDVVNFFVGEYEIESQENTEAYLISAKDLTDQDKDSIFFNFKNDIKPVDLWGGQCISRIYNGENLDLVLFDLKPGFQFNDKGHTNEQITWVVEGEMDFYANKLEKKLNRSNGVDIGKNHKQAILTINDRASGMLKMKKVASKEAKVVTSAINEILEDWIPYINTITADNGKEFAGHQQVAKALNIDYFFAHPYHSWERGSNENLNGLIRQYFKKGSDFSNLTDRRILDIETKLNSRPRKRFEYQTPIFVMEKLLFNSEVAFMS